MIQSIDLVWITVSDLKSAVKFYTEVIGLELKELHETFGWAELAGRKGGARLGVAQTSNRESHLPGQNAVIALSVADIEKTKAELLKKGAKMVGDMVEVPHIVKLQKVQDSDGNLLQLAQSLEK